MENITKTLKKQIQVNKLSHAYLILGEWQYDEIATLLEVSLADRFILEEPPIKIEALREMIRWIQLKPHSSAQKAVFIANIETMSQESANSILKILEEPPKQSIIFLQSKQKQRILPTILSRCQILKTTGQKAKVLPENYQSIEKIAKMNLKTKFSYAAVLATDEELKTILNLWEAEFRKRLLENEDVRPELKALSRTRDLLLSNSSVKLLLENLLIKIK